MKTRPSSRTKATVSPAAIPSLFLMFSGIVTWNLELTLLAPMILLSIWFTLLVRLAKKIYRVAKDSKTGKA